MLGSKTPQNLLVTIDVEDHAIDPAPPRFADALMPILETFADNNIKATFFVLGELVEQWQAELRKLREAGHEIALHGYHHKFLRDLGPDGLARDLNRSVSLMQDCLGITPLGFRAPYFSLTADTPWAPQVIADCGFTYSSSVLPAWNPQAGLVGVPRTPFRWDCGLLEFPSPVTGLGRFAIPMLGGAYVRLIPNAMVRWAARGRSASNGDWTYSHPYDFDAEEPFFQWKGQSWIVAKLIFARRQRMYERVVNLATREPITMIDVANRLVNDNTLPVVTPPQAKTRA